MTPIQEPEEENTRDTLTHLLNIKGGTRALAEAFDGSADRPCGVLIIDIDRFHAVNTQYGHRAGDVALVEFASRLRGAVGGDGELVRCGGQQFLALLPNATPDMACAFAERVCHRARAEPFDLHEAGSITITTSVGVACSPRNGVTEGTVVQSAHRALYDSKISGRDRWTLATQ